MVKNIYKRKDGRFEGRIPVYNIDGNRKYKAFFGKSIEEVIKKIYIYRESTKNISSNDISFQFVYTEWFQSVAYRIKESTAANYIR